MTWRFWLASLLFSSLVYSGVSQVAPPPCNSPIYCYGDLLHTVQMSGIFEDSKHFVDMSLRFEPETVLANFDALMNATGDEPTPAQVEMFVEENFNDSSYAFVPWTPDDWHENPQFLSNIADPVYRQWAADLHLIWKDLGRKISMDVLYNPQLYSLIYVPNPVIVPGGRYSEFYYWDTYWIVRGLLLSEMYSTARGMLENYVSMVTENGFVPNGGRIYFLNRSQPPFLTLMVRDYVQVTGDYDFLVDNFVALVWEFEFWMDNRMVDVEYDGATYQLARYAVSATDPRPESYKEDYLMAMNISEESRERFYQEIKSGAETGWDFSTRWFVKDGTNQGDLYDIHASSIVPVDLNSILCESARVLAEWAELLEQPDQSAELTVIADQLEIAINTVLWDAEEGVWLDYETINNVRRNYFHMSNLAPLFTGSYTSASQVDQVLSYLSSSTSLDYPGGMPTTLMDSGEQWDFPNGWPHLVQMAVIGLMTTNQTAAAQVALDLADKWVYNNLLGYNQSQPNAMFEKYDVQNLGLPGGGGEYDVQLGFGWTNGVVLDLLNMYGDVLSSNGPART